MTQYVWSSFCVLCIPDCLNNVFSFSYEVACYIQFWLVYSLVWIQLVVYQILSLPVYQEQNTETWMWLHIRHSCLQKYVKKFYTENLESKVLKLINENFYKLIYEQFKHVQLVVSLIFCYVCTCCCYTQLLITEINDMCLGIFVLYGNCNVENIERNKNCIQSCGW